MMSTAKAVLRAPRRPPALAPAQWRHVAFAIARFCRCPLQMEQSSELWKCFWAGSCHPYNVGDCANHSSHLARIRLSTGIEAARGYLSEPVKAIRRWLWGTGSEKCVPSHEFPAAASLFYPLSRHCLTRIREGHPFCPTPFGESNRENMFDSIA